VFSAGWLESHHGQFCDIFSLFPCPHTDLVRPDRTILCILNRLWAARIKSPTPNSAANTSKFQPVFYLRPKYWQQNALRCWLCPVHDLLGESHHMPKRTGITRGIASGKCPFSSLYARWSVKKEGQMRELSDAAGPSASRSCPKEEMGEDAAAFSSISSAVFL